jgi:formate-dependent nitrite reductase membrane component NrfD
VAAIVERSPVAVRRPEKETRPGLFYRGATQATLDPLAARRPAGGTYMWSEQIDGDGVVNSGHPGAWNSSAAAVLAYDVPHRAPWDWRVSLYTWTKSLAVGAYLVPLLLVLAGLIAPSSALWSWFSPVAAGAFLAITGLVLIWDLEHPTRFAKIFLRPQWRSWLVRGAVFISGFSVVLVAHFAASVAAAGGVAVPADLPTWLAVAGVPLAVLTAVYTAYLFAQAKARDLWQNPLLPPHLVVQAILAGAALALPAAWAAEPGAQAPLAALVAAASAVHLLLVAGEVTLTHPTAHARLATHELVRGRQAEFFWLGVGLIAAGLLAPLIGPAAGAAALVGLLAHEHAYVQAGQSVPLA